MKKKMQAQTRNKKPAWLITSIVLSIGCFMLATAYANDYSVGQVAHNITKSITDLAKLITAGAYVGGFGFAVGAILKFKAHKDNPTQIPVGTPIALIFIAAALIFLPSIFQVADQTVFNGSGSVGGPSGIASFTTG